MQKTKPYRISAVVLAAGESQRMGKVNKLKLSFGNKPMMKRIVTILLEANIAEIVVVLGHEALSIAEQLKGLPVIKTYNDDYKQGQMSSVYKGLQALTKDCDGIIICLADQPLLQTEDINKLIDAFKHRRQGSILIPVHNGQRGNPIILAYEHRNSILNSEINLGCKRLIEKHSEFVITVEMENNHVTTDIDTPEDYMTIQDLMDIENTGLNASIPTD